LHRGQNPVRLENTQSRPIHAHESELPESGGRVQVLGFFLISTKAAGKAVKSGHSCAAVTHQTKLLPCG